MAVMIFTAPEDVLYDIADPPGVCQPDAVFSETVLVPELVSTKIYVPTAAFEYTSVTGDVSTENL